MIEYPHWLCPPLSPDYELLGKPREPHEIYDEPDEVAIQQNQRLNELRRSKKGVVKP